MPLENYVELLHQPDGTVRPTAPVPLVAVKEPASDRVRRMRRSTALRRRLAVADLLAGATAGIAVTTIGGVDGWAGVAGLLIAGLIWPVLTFASGMYPADSLRAWMTGSHDLVRLIACAFAFSWIAVFLVSAVAGAEDAINAGIVGAVVAGVACVTGRAGARSLLHRDAALRQRTLIVGSGYVAGQVSSKLRLHPEFGLDAIGIVDDDVHESAAPGLPRLGTIDDLSEILVLGDVDRVVIAFSRATHEKLLWCIRACRERGVTVDVVPRLFEFLDGAASLDNVGGLPLITIAVPGLSRSSAVAKRLMDIVVSATVLFAMAPFLVLVALLIRLDSSGSPLFSQPRAGRHGRMFPLLKFRSMVVDAETQKADLVAANENQDGVMFKIRRDPRVTRFGALLRRYSIDEVPQLVNVLLGHMSLVGPRPLVLAEAEALGDWQLRRLDLRPGLTGPWQIRGRSNIPFQEMVRFDYQYVVGWSLARDVEILAGTIPAVLAGRGAY